MHCIAFPFLLSLLFIIFFANLTMTIHFHMAHFKCCQIYLFNALVDLL